MSINEFPDDAEDDNGFDVHSWQDKSDPALEQQQRALNMATVMSHLQTFFDEGEIFYLELGTHTIVIIPFEMFPDDVQLLLESCPIEFVERARCIKSCPENVKAVSLETIRETLHPIVDWFKENGTAAIQTVQDLFALNDQCIIEDNDLLIHCYLDALPHTPNEHQKNILFSLLEKCENTTCDAIKIYLRRSTISDAEIEASYDLNEYLRNETVREFRDTTNRSPYPTLVQTLDELQEIVSDLPIREQRRALKLFCESLPVSTPDDIIRNTVGRIYHEDILSLSTYAAGILNEFGFSFYPETKQWARRILIHPYANDHSRQYTE